MSRDRRAESQRQTYFRVTIVARLGDHRGVEYSAIKTHTPRREFGFRARARSRARSHKREGVKPARGANSGNGT